jgi:hypothetical protein
MTYTPSNIYYRAFETHVHGVLEKLDKRLPGLEDAQRNVEVVMARHGLYDAAFQQIVLLCSSIAPVCMLYAVLNNACVLNPLSIPLYHYTILVC